MTKLLISTGRSTELQPTASPSGEEVGQRGCHGTKRVPWYAAMLCRSGIHRGKWEYVTEGNCSQLKVCRRCGQTRVRTKHQREWRYIEDGNCDQVRICKRCGNSTRHRIKHTWGETWSSGDTRGRNCTRCGKAQTWEVSDSYD